MGSAAEGTTVWRRQLHVLAVALLGPVRHRWWKRGRPASPVVISRQLDVAFWGDVRVGPSRISTVVRPDSCSCQTVSPAYHTRHRSSCGKVGAARKGRVLPHCSFSSPACDSGVLPPGYYCSKSFLFLLLGAAAGPCRVGCPVQYRFVPRPSLSPVPKSLLNDRFSLHHGQQPSHDLPPHS